MCVHASYMCVCVSMCMCVCGTCLPVHLPCVPGPAPRLVLRAGHEEEEGETADAVGCCSLCVEHVQLHLEADSCPYVVKFDFLGKDSIHYYN